MARTHSSTLEAQPSPSRNRRRSPAERCRAKFLRFFPEGYRDETFVDWERDYKWQAHLKWEEQLGRPELERLIEGGASYYFPFVYHSRPSWHTYESLLEFAETVRRDTGDLKPRDMIDLQSFIWVQGSDEY